MVRRSKLELYFDVLEVIDIGVDKPTRIMYKTNLTWTNMKTILDNLTRTNFVRREDRNNQRRYYITDKGKRSLLYYKKSLEGIIELVK